MSRMILMVGMIGSGKSTLTRRLADAGAVVVNDDAMVTAMHGGNYQGYSKALKPLYKAVESAAVHAAVAMGRDVVIDRCCLDRATRARYVGLARALDVPCLAVAFPVEEPRVHANRRATHDARGYSFDYWLGVARAHAARYEPPTAGEGFDRVLSPDEVAGREAA